MQVLKDYYLELLLFAFCFANLAGLGIPQPLLYLPIMVLACFRLPMPCLAFMCLNFLKDVNHAFFFLNYHFSGVAPLTVLIGLVLSSDYIMKHSWKLLERGARLWLIVGYLLFTFILAGNYVHPSSKVTTLLTTAVLSYISYAYILHNRNRCDFYMMAIYSTLFAVFLMQLNISANHYGHLNSLIDFGFYRREIGADMYEDLASTGVTYATHYQFYGTMVSMCTALLFATTRIRESAFLLLSLFILISVGYTGARQYLVIMALLLCVYLLLSDSSLFFKSSFVTIAVIVGAFIVYQSVLSEYFFVVEEQGIFEGSGRGTTIERGWELFTHSPYFGMGFGGYNYYGDYKAYPHNMIIEMLAEIGFIGTIIISLILFSSKHCFKFLFYREIHFMGFYIVMVFFIRSMISLSLSQNIILFASFFALLFVRVPSKIITQNE